MYLQAANVYCTQNYELLNPLHKAVPHSEENLFNYNIHLSEALPEHMQNHTHD